MNMKISTLHASLFALGITTAQATEYLVIENPWGDLNLYSSAMNTVYGNTGAWAKADYMANPDNIFASGNKFVFLQGGDESDTSLNAFLAANGAKVLGWVSAGGKLIVESAGNTDQSISLAGVTLKNKILTETGTLTPQAISAAKQFPILYAQRSGNWLAHDVIETSGNIKLTPFVVGTDADTNQPILAAGMRYGKGTILFSGLTPYSYHRQIDGHSELAEDDSTWLLNMLTSWLLMGPSAADTLASMQRNAQGLSKVFSLQASYVNPGLSYDCSLFDKNGVCVAFSGRYTGTSGNGPEATSGVFTAAYKINPNIRVGGFIEQYASDYSSGGVEVKSSNPDFGVFGVWSQTGTDEGLKVRAAYRYGKRDLTITRDAIDTAEAGAGTSKLVTEGAQLTASYGYSLSNTVLASPYFGVRYTNIGRDGYTESASDTVTAPLHFDTLRQETTSLLAGVNLSALVAPSVTVNGSLGVETDTDRRVGKYSATGVADLASIEFNGDTRKTRMVGSVGMAYKIDNTQQISAQAWYREEAYGSTATTTGMLTYTAGF